MNSLIRRPRDSSCPHPSISRSPDWTLPVDISKRKSHLQPRSYIESHVWGRESSWGLRVGRSTPMALPHWYLPGDSAEREGERGPTSDPTTPPPPIPSSLLLLSPTPTEPPLLGHAHAHPRLPRPGASHGGRPHRAGGARGHPAAKRKKWTGEGVCARVVRTQANTPLTNRTGTGLRSAPRSNKATRLLTRPGRTTKSYAKDSSPRVRRLRPNVFCLATTSLNSPF